ncbi:Rieske (2Fe-2S) protein [Streptomyces sp. NPDC014802]|uniref:Rieske (2Fe-2S) protein n=1 Tax=Streptomyces sp. NPDC014802 TaxID=3364917 RepID=UPI0036F52E9E
MEGIEFRSDEDRRALLDGPSGARVLGIVSGVFHTIVKTKEAGYVAVNHVCPHLGKISFSGPRGRSDGSTISCGGHKWVWSLETGEGSDHHGAPVTADRQLAIRKVYERDGSFFII